MSHTKNFTCIVIVLFTICKENSGRYECTVKDFIRLGNSCYFFSPEVVSWQEAHFRCRDRESQLAVLGTQTEDATLRNYLEQPEFAKLGRWIGGMWAGTTWIWAAQGNEIENFKGFASSSVKDLSGSSQWNCLFMDPRNRYRWLNDDCIRQLHYICEAPLVKTEGDDETTVASNVVTTTPCPEPAFGDPLDELYEDAEEEEEDDDISDSLSEDQDNSESEQIQ